MWTIAEALVLLPSIEEIAKVCGYHIALGGSVMYRGESKKDLDIIVYKHKDPDPLRPEHTVLMTLLMYHRIIDTHTNVPNSIMAENAPFRRVISGKTKEEKRIDFIFL